MAKAITNNHSNLVPALLDKNKKFVTEDTEKANVLAEHYKDVHCMTLNMSELTVGLVNTNVQELLKTSISNDEIALSSRGEIVKAIRSVKSKKAPGLDGIQNIVLKNLPKKAIVQLNYIFNASFNLGYFPTQWNVANILPFHKLGKDKKLPVSYRPIRLLSTLSKIFEKIIYNRILDFENTNN